jgi:ketosteroid isomerase-like protein
MANVDSDEDQIRSLLENWAKAVRKKDIDGSRSPALTNPPVNVQYI